MDSLTSGLSSSQKEELIENVKQQIAIANAQELITPLGCHLHFAEFLFTINYALTIEVESKMSEKCFKKCIMKPGSSLDNSEQKCVAMCMDRYLETWNLVSKAYQMRIQHEKDRN